MSNLRTRSVKPIRHDPIFTEAGHQKKHNNRASKRKADLRNGEAIPIPPPTPKAKGAKTQTRPGLKAAANAAKFIRNS